MVLQEVNSLEYSCWCMGTISHLTMPGVCKTLSPPIQVLFGGIYLLVTLLRHMHKKNENLASLKNSLFTHVIDSSSKKYRFSMGVTLKFWEVVKIYTLCSSTWVLKPGCWRCPLPSDFIKGSFSFLLPHGYYWGSVPATQTHCYCETSPLLPVATFLSSFPFLFILIRERNWEGGGSGKGEKERYLQNCFTTSKASSLLGTRGLNSYPCIW